MKHRICPCCTSPNVKAFFQIPEAPVHSLVPLKHRQEAIRIPRKNIALTICNDCGLIYNADFDTAIDYYTKGYEDQQGFSPTFETFITGMARKFIDRYNLYNKTILEIGCGKGDFITLMSKLGNIKGIGIDPAWIPNRTDPGPRVRFIPEFFSEKHCPRETDGIVCRHTLEHIHAVGQFLRTVRTSLKEKRSVILLFEVPNILRILKEGAFWDIFYEHCSYFSPGALARLFRRSCFKVMDLYVEYDNQYLFIEAQKAEQQSEKRHRLEESTAELKMLALAFAETMKKKLRRWEIRLNRFYAAHQKVVLWGGGSKAVGFLTHFNDISLIRHVVDINPHMTGNYLPGTGIQYQSPRFLEAYRPDKIIIMNAIYQDEIRSMLNDMGLRPELICL